MNRILFTTPVGTARFPSLVEPEEFKGKRRYQVTLRVPTDEAAELLGELEALYESAMEETVGADTLRKLAKKGQELNRPRKPWGPAMARDGEDADGDPIYVEVEGFTDIRLKSNAERKTKSGKMVPHTLNLYDRYGRPHRGGDIGGGSRIKIYGTAMAYFQSNEVGYGVTLNIDDVVVHEARTGFSQHAIQFEAPPEGEEEIAAADDEVGADFR